MKPQNYFPTNYIVDFEYFQSLKQGNHLCGRIFHELFTKDNLSFLSLKDFIICTYEFNLINQAIYTHFQVDFNKWREIAPKILDEKCIYQSHPLLILEFAEKISNKKQKNINFTKQEILEWDIFIKKYIENMCANNTFNELTAEKFFEAIKNDPDCNNEGVKRYFRRLK